MTQIAFSPRQVAELLDVPYATICSEIRAGRLVARRVGKTYRVHRDALDEYLKCPAPANLPACISAPTLVSGSSETAEKIREPDIAAATADALLKKLSQGISRRR